MGIRLDYGCSLPFIYELLIRAEEVCVGCILRFDPQSGKVQAVCGVQHTHTHTGYIQPHTQSWLQVKDTGR